MRSAIAATLALGATLFLAVTAFGTHRPDPAAPRVMIETVAIAPGSHSYRLSGEYLRADRPVDPPLRTIEIGKSFDMMKYQVSAADYARCVADQGCEAVTGGTDRPDMPVTGVNFSDASAYAVWFSAVTGENWRLPTDAEWTFAAAERFAEDPLGQVGDDTNPAARWLARYRSEAGKAALDPEPKPRGYYGANTRGLIDIAGNVWDWTTTCYVRASLNDTGAIGETTENCGVRVVGGRHRGYMSHFIRDGKSGGCAAGMAPHNLGIRLVRDPPSPIGRLRRMLNRAVS